MFVPTHYGELSATRGLRLMLVTHGAHLSERGVLAW